MALRARPKFPRDDCNFLRDLPGRRFCSDNFPRGAGDFSASPRSAPAAAPRSSAAPRSAPVAPTTR